MTKSRRKLSNIILITFAVAVLFLIYSCMYGDFERQKKENSGIPDVVSSRMLNDDCYLAVVANCNAIENRKAFAEKVIYMYQKNEFSTTKFSTDMEETPRNLYVTVYLEKSDIKKGNEIFRFCYDADTQKILIKTNYLEN